MKLLLITVILLASAAECLAQSVQKELLDGWKESAKQIIDIAEAMPADKYDFKPTKEVRTFGEQVRHVAEGVSLFLAAAKNDRAFDENKLAKLKTKDEIVTALRKSIDEMTAVISSLTDKSAAEVVDAWFLGKRTRNYVYTQALIHNGEHYGQMVVYLRLNGIVPPASRK